MTFQALKRFAPRGLTVLSRRYLSPFCLSLSFKHLLLSGKLRSVQAWAEAHSCPWLLCGIPCTGRACEGCCCWPLGLPSLHPPPPVPGRTCSLGPGTMGETMDGGPTCVAKPLQRAQPNAGVRAAGPTGTAGCQGDAPRCVPVSRTSSCVPARAAAMGDTETQGAGQGDCPGPWGEHQPVHSRTRPLAIR